MLALLQCPQNSLRPLAWCRPTPLWTSSPRTCITPWTWPVPPAATRWSPPRLVTSPHSSARPSQSLILFIFSHICLPEADKSPCYIFVGCVFQQELCKSNALVWLCALLLQLCHKNWCMRISDDFAVHYGYLPSWSEVMNIRWSSQAFLLTGFTLKRLVAHCRLCLCVSS